MIGVIDNFHSAAFGQIIQPILRLYVSFDKSLSEGSFFRLNQSQLNGPDILRFAASDADTQSWDFYNYVDYSDRLVSMSWERSIEFPYTVQCGMADFTLDNTDGFFTPMNPKSAIGANNLPARPIRISAGFKSLDGAEAIPQMAGITEGMPSTYANAKTVGYHAVDMLQNICGQTLKSVVIARDSRTDEIIADILQSCGLAPSQYSLARGRFTIPFAFFDVGASVGDALKQIVQAEGGFMWLDELGVIRFETYAGRSGVAEVVATLSDYQIMSLESGDLSEIINHVKINAELREVQEYQEVYTKSSSLPSSPGQVNPDSLWVVPARGTKTISCGLSDPCYDVVAPTIGRASSVSWFTAVNLNLVPVTSGVTATGVLSSKAFNITFTNDNGYNVIIDEMKLWGEPAKVYEVLDYEAYDEESMDSYGDQLLEIGDNQFFQTYQQANSFASTVLKNRSEYNRIIKAEIKGDFAFQLLDLIKIDTSSEQYNGIYQITSISYDYSNYRLTTKLTLNATPIYEGEFTLNVSQLNGEDLIQ